jgi:hypothetical protein
MGLYNDVMGTKDKPLYASEEEALLALTAEYEALGAKYGMTGYDLWFHAEHEASAWTEDLKRIRSLHRMIGVCRRFIEKRKKNA